MRWRELEREACSVARTLSVIGDRWTLLILRDCFLRVRRFDSFEARLGISRHRLADRLRKLVAAGVLARVRYEERPPRYEYRLTEKGLALHPVLMALVHWGDCNMARGKGPPLLFEHRACGRRFEPATVCSACGEALDPRAVRVLPGPGAATGRRRPRTPAKPRQRT